MDEQEIGELVRRTRIEKGLSYRDLAELCGLGRDNTRVIQKVEKAEAYQFATLARICAALGLVVKVTPDRNVTKR